MSYALLCVATVAYLARRARRARVRCVHDGGAWLWVDETEGEEL